MMRWQACGAAVSLGVLLSTQALAATQPEAPDWREQAPFREVVAMVASLDAARIDGTVKEISGSKRCAFGHADRGAVLDADGKERIIWLRNELLYDGKVAFYYDSKAIRRFALVSGYGYRLEVYFDEEGGELRRYAEITSAPVGLAGPLQDVVMPLVPYGWSAANKLAADESNECMAPFADPADKHAVLIWGNAEADVGRLRRIAAAMPFLKLPAGMPQRVAAGTLPGLAGSAVIAGICPVDQLRNSAPAWILGAVNTTFSLRLVPSAAVGNILCPEAQVPLDIANALVDGGRLVGIWLGQQWHIYHLDSSGALVRSQKIDWHEWDPDICEVSHRPRDDGGFNLRRSCREFEDEPAVVLTEEVRLRSGRLDIRRRERRRR